MQSFEAPRARKGSTAHELHGLSWTDEYAWLREKANPELLAHLEAENEFTRRAMQSTESLRSTLYEEILGRIQETDLTVPIKEGPYLYYTRTEKGRQYPLYCRKADEPDAAEAIYLDSNTLAEGHDYFRLGVIEPSPDHRLLAYSTDIEGDEDYTISVKDLATGELQSDRIERTYDSLAWAADNQSFYYSVLDEARRPYRIFHHLLGKAASEDTLVFEESDERFRVELFKTRSKRFFILEVASSTTTEIWLSEDGEFRLFRPRQQDIEYSLTHQGDYFYIRINDQGRNFRLLRTPVNQWQESAWEEVLPHRQDVYLENATAFANYLVVTERSGGLRRFRFQRNGESTWKSIEFPEAAYAVGLSGNAEYEANSLRYQYQSPVTPPSVFDYNLETGIAELKKQLEVPGGFDASLYCVERMVALSHDKTAVPIVLFYRKGLNRDLPHPTLLYGYGAYGSNSDAGFSGSRLSLVDRGVVYAIAQVRGGAEMGQPWHDAGRMQNKRNSFLDFVACAETLIAEGWTERSKLIIEGGSAGGLLVGAAVTMRPELFGGVLAHVPFVDVVHTMLDATLPLTVGEYEEWGNPADPEAFEYIRSYSPYENVRQAEYPPMLVTAGLNDPRVSYWEPSKWVARLRENNLAQSEILLKINMGAGHFGASGRYDRIREVAFEFAWLLKTWRLI
ncbi:S9 family peptidase [Bryobacter aggregatus]|uniref:S9 family peptidase n=1 Tax=Bryobacter aggregatus TaxID=360054 RepID=UPI000566E9A7|nr:S9 family peptidase [Bryobacter aggregatus]